MANIQQISPTPTSQSNSISTARVPTLLEDRSNWIIYRESFLTAVFAKGLRRYLDGTEKQPIPTSAYSVDPDADENYEKAVDQWTANHANIKLLPLDTVPESLKLEITAKHLAIDTWGVVIAHYDTLNQGDFVQAGLLEQMHMLKCDDGADPCTFLTQLAKLRVEYTNAGGVLSDNQYRVLIICLLPDSCRPSVRAVMLSAQTAGCTLTSTILLNAINELARNEHALDQDTSSASALAAGANVRCYNCKKLGHVIAECRQKGGGKEDQGKDGKGKRCRLRKKKGEKEKESSSSGASANTAQTPVQTASMASVVVHNVARESCVEDYTFWNTDSACYISTDFVKLSSDSIPRSRYVRLVDSGASQHFEPHCDNFISFRQITPIPINSADGRVFYATGKGDVCIVLGRGKDIQDEFVLHDVLYAPSMPISLISVSRLVASGFQVQFKRGGCHLTTPSGTCLTPVPERNGLYPLSSVEPISQSPCVPEMAAATLTQLEFHRRMAHAYPPTFQKMIRDGVVTGIDLEAAEVEFCEVCQKAKQTRKPFPKVRSSPHATKYGQHVHTDVWGKAQVRSWDGKEYFITFLDEYSDEAFVSLMRTKSEALAHYRAYKAWAKTHRGVTEVQFLQSDRGGEYTGAEFNSHLAEHGTLRNLTVHDSPQSNSKAERLNCTLAEHARALLFDAGLPKFLWGEAILHAAWLRNRTTSKNTPGSTPHERGTGQKPNLSNLPCFGVTCWMHQENVGKLDPKSKPARWVGYELQSKGHKVYWPDRHTVLVERNIRFEPDTVVTETVGVQGENSPPSGPATPPSPPPGPAATNPPAPNPAQPPAPAAPTNLPNPATPAAPESAAPHPDPPPTTMNPPPPDVSPPGAPVDAPEHVLTKRDVAELDAPAAPVESEASSSRPRRTRQPSRWVRDLQAGLGSTGGRGAQRVPKSVLKPSACLAGEIWDDVELEGEVEEEEEDIEFESELDVCGCASHHDLSAFVAPVQGTHCEHCGNMPLLFTLAAMSSSDEPTYRDAMAGPEKDNWLAAMKDELTRINKMGTYELVEHPRNANIVGSVWALRKKRDEHNNVAKFKARLCAQGFSQVPGIDYTQTASPTARTSSFRFALALAAALDLEVHQIDFKNVYLNGKLEKTIYMRQPPDFAAPGKENFVWRLRKALYSLKQAGLMWYKVVCKLMDNIRLHRSKHDPGVFFLAVPGILIIVVIHVDDCLLMTKGTDLMRALKDQLRCRFKISDLGEARWLLGFDVLRDRPARTISLSQRAYIDTMLTHFRMTDSHPLTVPLDPHANLFKFELTAEEREEMKRVPYAQLVGSLMYATVGTRLDIAFVVPMLSRFMSDPAGIHWEAAKRVLHYLKGTRDYRLTYGPSKDGLSRYTDAD